MIGQSLALLSGFGFATTGVFMRQAVFRTGETATSVFVTVFFGTVLFSLVFALSGNVGQLATASWQAIAALAGAGLIVFVIGRWLNYHSLKLIGANRNTPLLNTSTLVGVVMGVTVVGEPFTIGLGLGVVFIVTGVVLISTETSATGMSEGAATKGDLIKGVATGLSAGVCYGIGPVLVKIAIDEGNSPFTGLFISYVTSLVFMVVPRLVTHRLGELVTFYRKAALPMSMGGMSTSVAQLCRYVSLDYIAVSAALPLNATAALFVLPLSFIINRRIELFTWRIVAGAILVVAGVFLIFQLQ